ncbi:hypothetical protein Vafri_3215 [Volvox africanus]|uniref:Uncharacterized protein n=1 Tax=Volvox africanus TaxID=51714 RepID=A0A8J4ARH7_9CHLO|nr:hypothetical protein Vafri_3215 [Volvox africanus]
MHASTVIRTWCRFNVHLETARAILNIPLRTISTGTSGVEQPSVSGQDVPLGWLGKEIKANMRKDPPLSWVYMREGPDGLKRFMPWSERVIWGTVLGGITFFFGPRIYRARKQAAEEREAAQRREEELRQKRLTAARVLLSGKSWVRDEAEAFEGMTPKQIVEFIFKHSINPDDPFEVR